MLVGFPSSVEMVDIQIGSQIQQGACTETPVPGKHVHQSHLLVGTVARQVPLHAFVVDMLLIASTTLTVSARRS